MVLYGGLGWLIDRWTGTSDVFAPIGVVFGLAAGLFLTFRQLSVLEKQEREALLRKRRALVDTEVRAGQQDRQDQQGTQTAPPARPIATTHPVPIARPGATRTRRHLKVAVTMSQSGYTR